MKPPLEHFPLRRIGKPLPFDLFFLVEPDPAHSVQGRVQLAHGFRRGEAAAAFDGVVCLERLVEIHQREQAQGFVGFVAWVAAPVADGLRTGIAQRHVTRADRMHLGAKHLHALHVRVLTLHIRGTHKHFALHVHQRTHRCCSHTVLSNEMKNALINAIKSQSIKTSKTVTIGGIQCYVRQATIASQREIEAQQGDDAQLRIIALILCDEHGVPIFDKDDSEDLSILENLTTETITQIVHDYAVFNGFRQPETEKK